MDHCGCPALGYIIVSQRAGGLKDEYKGLPKSSMRELIKSGVTIKADPVDTVEVAYTGDTCAQGLEVPYDDGHQQKNNAGGLALKRLEYLKQTFLAPSIFCELTFIEPDQRELAQSRGHMHIDDILPILNSHGLCLDENNNNMSSNPTSMTENNDDVSKCKRRELVFIHFSGRNSVWNILDKLCDNLPKSVQCFSRVAISSFLTTKQKQYGEEGYSNTIVKLMNENGYIALNEYIRWKSATADPFQE